MPDPAVRIVTPTTKDVPVILALFRELAIYEKLEQSMTVTEATLTESLFGERPAAEVRLALTGDEAVGYMVFFHNFSTFLGRAGIYLEDLYVKPEHRGKGIGKQLFAELARIAVQRHCQRLEWMVLNWNTTAIDFYKSIGAQSLTGWAAFRLTGAALDRMAEKQNEGK
jgi:GNAT superfamily N-acetyltransferase